MNFKKPKFNYSQKDMLDAVESVKTNKINAYKASKNFQVPRSTLLKILSEKTVVCPKMGPLPILGVEYEQMLVNCIKAIAKKRFLIVKWDLLSFAR